MRLNDSGSNGGDPIARHFADLLQAIRRDGEAIRPAKQQMDLLDQIRNALDRRADHLSNSNVEWVADSFSVERIAYESETTRILELRHRDLGTKWALKTIPLSRRDDVALTSRLRREAEIGLQLRHPCLLETSALLRLRDGSPGLLQPWHPLSLAAVSSERNISTKEVETLLRHILAGLETMHDNGYAHCDVSPANIFLPEGDFEQARLADFGISLRFGEQHTDIGLTYACSPEFAAPEQLNGDAASPAQDLFAVGQVARRLIMKVGEQPSAGLVAFSKACCETEIASRPSSVRDAMLFLDTD